MGCTISQTSPREKRSPSRPHTADVFEVEFKDENYEPWRICIGPNNTVFCLSRHSHNFNVLLTQFDGSGCRVTEQEIPFPFRLGAVHFGAMVYQGGRLVVYDEVLFRRRRIYVLDMDTGKRQFMRVKIDDALYTKHIIAKKLASSRDFLPRLCCCEDGTRLYVPLRNTVEVLEWTDDSLLFSGSVAGSKEIQRVIQKMHFLGPEIRSLLCGFDGCLYMSYEDRYQPVNRENRLLAAICKVESASTSKIVCTMDLENNMFPRPYPNYRLVAPGRFNSFFLENQLGISVYDTTTKSLHHLRALAGRGPTRMENLKDMVPLPNMDVIFVLTNDGLYRIYSRVHIGDRIVKGFHDALNGCRRIYIPHELRLIILQFCYGELSKKQKEYS